MSFLCEDFFDEYLEQLLQGSTLLVMAVDQEANVGAETESGALANDAPGPQNRGKKRAKDISREVTPATEEVVLISGGAEGEKLAGGKRRKSMSVPMIAARTLPLLVCSIGNPGTTYANTLHSAGHTVVNKLAAHLGYSQFRKERAYGNGLISNPAIAGGTGDWTLCESTTYMNELARACEEHMLLGQSTCLSTKKAGWSLYMTSSRSRWAQSQFAQRKVLVRRATMG